MRYRNPLRKYSHEERSHVYDERRKELLPTTKSPFNFDVNDKSQQLAQGERAPAWIDLFLDLSLVGCLTVFSSVHEVSLPHQVGTYVAFFSMLWFIWTTQVIYDVRYEMQDWVHRVAKLCQFGIFAFMAAYGGEFSAETYSEPPDMDVEDAFEWSYQGQAFKGVVLTLAISRLLLALQYCLVFFYSHPSHRRAHAAQPILCFVSGISCLVAWLIRGAGTKLAAVKILLLYGAIFLECVGTGYIARRKKGGGRLPRESMLAERFGLITLIILGEGAIGVFEAMHNAVAGLGLTPTSYSRVICAISIHFALWWIIFSNFDKERPFTNFQAQMFLWLHFPFHLVLVLFLQGVKRLTIHTNLFSAISIIFNQWQQAIDESRLTGSPDFNPGSYPKLYEALHLLNLALPPDLNSPNKTLATQEFLRFAVDMISTLFQKYGIIADDSLLTRIDAFKKNDNNTNVPNAIEITNDLLQLSTNYATYICPTLGAILITWVLMSLVQRWPRDALGLITILPRALLGIGFCLLGFLNLAFVPAEVLVNGADTTDTSGTGLQVDTGGSSILSKWLDANWMLPLISIVLWVHIISDWCFQRIFIKRYDRRQREVAIHSLGDSDANLEDARCEKTTEKDLESPSDEVFTHTLPEIVMESDRP